MGELRTSLVTGRTVAIAPRRGTRPGGGGPPAAPFPNPADSRCPFCPGNEDELPEILWEEASSEPPGGASEPCRTGTLLSNPARPRSQAREGFGLTVIEGMWKGKPVVGGNTGGIRLQITDHKTGFRVNSPEGAALRIRQLLHDDELRHRIGTRAREFVREHFLLTRLLREHLTIYHALLRGEEARVDLASPWPGERMPNREIDWVT